MRSLQAIVVTGAAGCVGSGLVRRLLATEGVEKVVGIDLKPEEQGLASLASLRNDPRFAYLCADISDELTMMRIVRELEATGVINLTDVRSDGAELDRNILGPSALLRVCRKTGVPLLHASTDAVYGEIPSPERATENWPLHPTRAHAAAKAAAEFLCFAACREFGQDVIVTRAATTYGPRLPQDHHLTRFIASAVRGEPLLLPGDGRQIRDWLHLDDHCDGLIEAFRRAKGGQAYNVGGRCERTFLGIARSVLKTLRLPEDLIRTGPMNGAMDARRATDASRLTSYTGWIPQCDFKSAFPTVVREAAANLAQSPGKDR